MSQHWFHRQVPRAPLLALALALTAACSGDGPSNPDPEPGPTGPGSVSGEVRTQDDQAVGGVRVTLLPEAADSVRTAESGPDGRFAFASVPAGRYQLSAEPPTGYDPPAAPTPVTVLAEQPAAASVRVQAVREREVTVAPGGRDTVALASGLVAEITGTSTPVTVSLRQQPQAALGGFDLVAPTVSVSAGGTAASARAGVHPSAAAAETDISVRVWQRVPTCASAPATLTFEVSRAAGEPPVFLYTESSCTTYTDPRTGRTGAAYVADLLLGPGTSTNLGMFTRDSDCEAGRALYPLPGAPENTSLTPLILIHGLQPFKVLCRQFRDWEPGEDTFGELAQALRADPVLAGRYQLYVLRYPSFEPIANTSAFLRAEVVRRGWADRDIAIVGHSMGGLVGRGYIAAHGADRVRALITLGTPHLGSPTAQPGLARALAVQFCTGSLSPIIGAAAGLFPGTRGMQDLSPSSPWINTLREQRRGADRIYTVAGEAVERSVEACVLNRLTGSAASDGVVPVASALPDWTTLQLVVDGANHTQVKGAQAVPRVREILGRLAQCRAGTIPDPPASNAFPLSGTLARLPDGRIDVVLNPIVVGGNPVLGLTGENFSIIENNCLKDFDVTTDEGNVGVDLVFIQDLSGSMGPSITGVRNSVLTFAESLRTRGLNVRIGSVGYSGQGTIVTGGDDCEALGPVQSLTSPAEFRTHVVGNWFASGGCDAPENALEAVEYAHRNMAWRSGAARVYILITDVSIHAASTNCNGRGPCTDHTLASIVSLVGSTATLHAIAPSSAAVRTIQGGLDPWLLAERLGGAKLALGTGNVDLNALGIADRIAEIVRLSFTSTSDPAARHRIRVRVQVNGQLAEIAPGLIEYEIHSSLLRPAPH